MRKFLVRFWYNTDCRLDSEVHASNEVAALVLALEEIKPQIQYKDWISAPGFRITIDNDGTL